MSSILFGVFRCKTVFCSWAPGSFPLLSGRRRRFSCFEYIILLLVSGKWQGETGDELRVKIHKLSLRQKDGIIDVMIFPLDCCFLSSSSPLSVCLLVSPCAAEIHEEPWFQDLMRYFTNALQLQDAQFFIVDSVLHRMDPDSNLSSSLRSTALRVDGRRVRSIYLQLLSAVLRVESPDRKVIQVILQRWICAQTWHMSFPLVYGFHSNLRSYSLSVVFLLPPLIISSFSSWVLPLSTECMLF